ncbi:hypothetical protein Fmac_001843 [Flemingia macrophylla]|uniref:Uncharacterized protein n=1 Tax=Flemingia macrophylla TaxID=520843 RepID=A0ABD1NJ17_9FABA
MEVAPSSSMEFNFDSTSSSPYITAPSSPQHFPHFFFSAPASPRRHSSAATTTTTTTTEFQFDFGVHLPRPSLSADELFLAGKIRPLEFQPPPPNPKQKQQPIAEPSSPLESCDDDVSPRKSSSKSSETSFLWFTRKWRIKDFLLFRSASEGRASDKDPFRKYAVLSKTTAHEDVRNSSFRSAQSSGSVSRRRGPVSAHELHYTVNRAASVQSKKKTLLPYKQGLSFGFFLAGIGKVARYVMSPSAKCFVYIDKFVH